MLIALALFLKTLCYAALCCIVIGFVRPVYVLWFMDRSNRIKVIQLYGTLAGTFFVLYLLLSQLFL